MPKKITKTPRGQKVAAPSVTFTPREELTELIREWHNANIGQAPGERVRVPWPWIGERTYSNIARVVLLMLDTAEEAQRQAVRDGYLKEGAL